MSELQEQQDREFYRRFHKVADRDCGGGLFGTLAMFYKRVGKCSRV